MSGDLNRERNLTSKIIDRPMFVTSCLDLFTFGFLKRFPQPIRSNIAKTILLMFQSVMFAICNWLVKPTECFCLSFNGGSF